MESKWTMTLSPGDAANNSATAAIGDSNIYVGATPNTLFALGRESGTPAWASSTGVDVFAYQPLTLANSVLYTINDPGFFMAFDASSGASLLNRLISEDAGVDLCTGVGAGVAVARNTVYVPCDAGGRADAAGGEGDPGALVAYQ